ncbi:Arylsulfatase A [Planctomycetales bacterium 10988]|nr:Arylsulfatase A [Planctomycetales bacterium 10988]
MITTFRKLTVHGLLGLAASFFMIVAAASPSHAETKPNILWIIGEDLGPELSCYGTPGVNTPTLDSLAERGVLYRNAFTVTPVCSTSRSSFMTGMYAMAIDAQNHRSHRDGTNPLPDGVRVLTDWLRPAGYAAANIRKLTDDRQDGKFYKGTGKTDWNFNYPNRKKPFDISDWKELKANQPFYAQVNFSETHRGGAWNDAHKYIDEIADPEEIELPPYYPDHPVSRAVWAQYLNTVMAADKKVKYILDLLKRDGLAKNTIVVFLGDHGRAMPRGKQWPYDSGLHIPLIIYWPEGNADLPEPEGYKRGTENKQLIASTDLSATTLAWAGLDKPEKMQGRVFLGEQREPARKYLFAGRDRGDETVDYIRTVRDSHYRYIRNGYPERPFLQLNRYKERQYPIIGLLRSLHEQGELTGPPLVLMNPTRPKEELYYVKGDPWEVVNLADNPEYADVKARLSQVLDQWIEEIDDQGRIPEDPQMLKEWDQRLSETYDEDLKNRPDDWFYHAPALGPYAKDIK